MAKATKKGVSGYGSGGIETVISVEEVTKQVSAIAQDITPDQLLKLANDDPYVSINNLKAGYGKMEILHDINLHVARKQSPVSYTHLTLPTILLV